LKDAITWPLNCLESESLLSEKLRELKLAPEYYHMATHTLDDDRHLLEFINREENKVFLNSIKNSTKEVRLRAEGVLKFEFVVLKER
jgi:hypothetical protein